MTDKVEFHFDSPKDSPGFLLTQLTLLWQRKQRKVLDPLDLTHTQFVIMASLGWLSRENVLVTQVEIAKQSNYDRMMVSKVLRTLETKKFVSRQEHDMDTRAKVIKLTKDGMEILQKAIIEVENADIDFFSTLEPGLKSFNSNVLKLIRENSTD